MTYIIYEDDVYRAIVVEEYRTIKNRSNVFTKTIHLYLGSKIGTSSYLNVELNYNKNDNTIITFFEYEDYLPNDINSLRYQLKYNPLCVKRLYDLLFSDIKNRHYMREKTTWNQYIKLNDIK